MEPGQGNLFVLPILLEGKSMSSFLIRRGDITKMIIQAIIIKKEVLLPTPRQAALSALEHVSALPEPLGTQRKTSKPSSHPLRISGDLVKL